MLVPVRGGHYLLSYRASEEKPWTENKYSKVRVLGPCGEELPHAYVSSEALRVALYLHVTAVTKSGMNIGHQVKVKLFLHLFKSLLFFFLRKALFRIGYTMLALERNESPSFKNHKLIHVTLSHHCLNETLLMAKIISFKLVTDSICQADSMYVIWLFPIIKFTVVL